MLRVAMRLFSERAYADVSVDEVAAGAGVTKPMVYAYFESKEGLFAACVRRAGDRLVADLERAAAHHAEAEQRMWHMLLEVFRFIASNRESWGLLYGAGDSGNPFAGPAAAASEAMARLLTDVFADTAKAYGIAPGAAGHNEALAHAMVGATIAMGRWWLAHPEEPAELQAVRLMNFGWMGFGDLMQGRFWLPPPPGAAS
jgi:AcrR family transcriptional regulator